jgi:hypothetical protein
MNNKTKIIWGSSVAGASLIGVYVGARMHEHELIKSLIALTVRAVEEKAIDKSDASSVLNAAVRIANSGCGLAVLSTTSPSDGISTRLMQPLPVEMDADSVNSMENPIITFHTSCKSRKFAELLASPNCTCSFVDPSVLTCVTFVGSAKRMTQQQEEQLIKDWPSKMPPLSMFYPKETLSDFTAWTLQPNRIEIVSPPAGLVTKGREDWRAPEIKLEENGWQVAIKAGVEQAGEAPVEQAVEQAVEK